MKLLPEISAKGIWKLSLWALAISFLLLLFFPTYAFWHPGEYEDTTQEWVEVYLIQDIEIGIFIFPFFILFPLLFLIKGKIRRILFKIVLLPFAGFCTLFGMVSGMPAPDFSPGIGCLILLTILPQLLLFYYFDYIIKSMQKDKEYENQ